MSDQKKSANTPIYESQEAIYAKAVKKMQADKLIVQYDYKIENYLVAASMFEELKDYLDSEKLAEECRELVEKTRKEKKESLYRKALEKKKNCMTIKDFENVKKLFADLGKYENAEQEQLECEKNIKKIVHRKKGNHIRALCIFLVCCGLVATFFFAGFFEYTKGMYYIATENYERAEELFADLGDFMNSSDRVEECAEKEKNKKEEQERKALLKAKAGDEFSFGKYTWKVLERKEDLVYMIATQINDKSEFYNVAFNTEQKEIDWEDSSLRRWLNSEVLDSCFTEEEKALLVQMDMETNDVEKYDANVQKETTTADYIRILSIEEAELYMDILKTLGLDCWLRSPGSQGDTAAYITAGHLIMTYGCPVSSTQLSVRPVILVDCSKLEEE